MIVKVDREISVTLVRDLVFITFGLRFFEYLRSVLKGIILRKVSPAGGAEPPADRTQALLHKMEPILCAGNNREASKEL